MQLLLDSHVVLWALYEPEKVTARARIAIAEPKNDLWVSHAALWEIANKAATFRLPLVGTTIDNLLVRLDNLDVTILPIDLADVLASASLPDLHRDPFDRMMIAQAQSYGLTLVSHDHEIHQYDLHILW